MRCWIHDWYKIAQDKKIKKKKYYDRGGTFLYEECIKVCVIVEKCRKCQKTRNDTIKL